MRRQIGYQFVDRRRNRTALLLEASQIVGIREARIVRQGMECKVRSVDESAGRVAIRSH